LYLNNIPKTVTYESFVALIRGGLIDDIYISGLSPDYVRHQQGSKGATDEENRAWFGYITFYTAIGAKKFIDYLNYIDGSPDLKTYGNNMIVAFMTIEGVRLPVQLRDNDQRELAPDVVNAVEKDKATRVLTFTFRKGISRGVRRPHGITDTKLNKSDGHIKWDWAAWRKAFTEKNSEAALARISEQIQVWGKSPVIYVDNMKILSPMKEETKAAALKPTEETFKVQVSFLRISSAEKVKSHLDHHRDYVDNCSIYYAPDPCSTREVNIPKLNLEILGDGEDVSSSLGKSSSSSKKNRKKRKPEVDDKQIFPPLPGSPPKDSTNIGWTASAKVKEAPSSPPDALPLPVVATTNRPKAPKVAPNKKKANAKLPNKPSEGRKGKKGLAAVKPETKTKGSPTPSLKDEKEFPALGSPKTKGG
jgi:hypothetical protein